MGEQKEILLSLHIVIVIEENYYVLIRNAYELVNKMQEDRGSGRKLGKGFVMQIIIKR